VRRLSRMPMTAGVVTRLAYARAKSAGLAMQPLLRGAHLTRRQIEDQRARLRVRDQIEFLNLVAQALDDRFLGFHLGERADLRTIGLLYYALASSETLIEVFRRTERYCSILNEGAFQKCIEGRQLGLAAQYRGVSRHLDRHQVEFWAAAMLRVFRELTGIRIRPTHVRFIHVRQGVSPFARFFGCEIEFGAATDELTFRATAARLPVLKADPYLNRLLLGYCEEAIAHRPRARESFRSRVENSVVPLLPHGTARASPIAHRLGVSQRTLARRLASEGVTFSSVLNELRHMLARCYLEEKNLSISQIAWLLGYHGVSAFSHAFKRWTGKTPREAAARLR
jgi:AraC-like DNA-binding protein